LEEKEILAQLLPPNIDKQLLANSVATHVPLNGRCVHILVRLHHIGKVVFVSGPPPGFLDPNCRLYSSLLHFLKPVFAN